MRRQNTEDRRQNHKKGFTLVEVVVVTAILLLVVGFLGYLSVKHFLIYNNQMSELTIEHDARLSLDDVDNYVRSAYRVIESYDTYTTGDQTLILHIPSIDSSDEIIDSTYDTVVFYLSGSSLVREVFANASSSREDSIKTLANGVDVDTFSFTYDDANYDLVKEVTTSLTILQGSKRYERSITISSQSFLRNY